MDDCFARCARLLMQADGLLVTAGAGLGVDSGLPDFRGSQGLWGAYPALGAARMDFHDIASPQAFRDDPRLAWGFYGHRLGLYRDTVPGPAFGLLQRIAQRLPKGAFVFTSNVDGQFQKAGFDPGRIAECHGSIHHLQCLDVCTDAIWPADDFVPQVAEAACRLLNALPTCPHCGGLARPNILMFGDGEWLSRRSAAQQSRYPQWRRGVDRLLVIEIGAGTAIPSVRFFGESQGAPLIRINLREAATASDNVSLPMTSREALHGIAAALSEEGWLTDARDAERAVDGTSTRRVRRRQ